ncbi:uncharacterized protein LOC119791820 isoform X2 [Cyprinodon tularosa]|uniref:uncharacterized protein LOC119791820 isoform X2 n=1 Tax=Cyprinodon tularosa TaxID=77115 RepID=UPI0018E221B8|nr:uncharacterized protein LOC119791820 isoform X2 [Cyprinodon tularosa]
MLLLSLLPTANKHNKKKKKKRLAWPLGVSAPALLRAVRAFLSFCLAMAPNLHTVHDQTSEVIFFLLADETEAKSRMLDSSEVESDGPEDDFDPVLVADKLRTVADALNEEKIKPLLKEMSKAAANEAVDAAFSKAVETICESYSCKGADVAPEMQLINATVALGLYVKKVSPDLKRKVQGAMTNFLNNRVSAWVVEQGGWDKLPISK